MNTYRDQYYADMARIKKKTEGDNSSLRFAKMAGAYDAFAYYYASSADHEAAKAQRIGRDPKAFMEAFTGQVAGPSAADITILLHELQEYLRLRPELDDVKFYVEAATASAAFEAREEQHRAEEAEARDYLTKEEQRDTLIGRGILTC